MSEGCRKHVAALAVVSCMTGPCIGHGHQGPNNGCRETWFGLVGKSLYDAVTFSMKDAGGKFEECIQSGATAIQV
jgi:hypothetical protein